PKPVTLTVKDLLDMELDYEYDDLTIPRHDENLLATARHFEQPGAGQKLLAANSPDAHGIELTVKQIKSVTLPAVANVTLESMRALAASAPDKREVILLSLEGVKAAARRPGSLYYDVFVNLPPGETSKVNGPYYAGRISFFGLEQGH